MCAQCTVCSGPSLSFNWKAEWILQTEATWTLWRRPIENGLHWCCCCCDCNHWQFICLTTIATATTEGYFKFCTSPSFTCVCSGSGWKHSRSWGKYKCVSFIHLHTSVLLCISLTKKERKRIRAVHFLLHPFIYHFPFSFHSFFGLVVVMPHVASWLISLPILAAAVDVSNISLLLFYLFDHLIIALI